MTRITYFFALLVGWLIDWYIRITREPIDQEDCDDYNDTEGRPPEDR